jgi:2,4-dienoyl-CoA reductase-like NADH-dependent reductase (Old Yellow Enzyme family)
LWIKLNSEDFVPGGLELEPSLAVAETLEKMGVAAFEISGGTPAAGRKGVSRMRIKGPQDEAYFLPQIRRFRERLSSPVIAVGGFRSFEISEEVVARGHADLVALARALVREPHLIRRWREGDRSPALCISCNRCFKESMSVQGLGCHEERKKERKA